MSNGTTDYGDAFIQLAQLRFELLSKNYEIDTPSGKRNQAYERDNTFDILEEVADISTILQFLVGRISEKGAMSTDQLEAVRNIAQGIGYIVTGCSILDSCQDASYREESVDRVVTREEVGLD